MLGIYITAGYPNSEATIESLRILEKASVDFIELGVPFSDPLADGPVIQKAAHESLQQGMNLDKILDLFEQSGVKTKTILFSYYNPLHAYGFDKVAQRCKETGIQGVLIPDLPVDEAEGLSKQFKAAGLDLVLMAAITSTEERLKKIYELSNPFVYLVSRVGITGAGDSAKEQAEKELLDKAMAKLKSFGTKPIALGFGIDSKEKVEAAYKQGADMAIIGTKTVKLSENLKDFESFIQSLRVE